MFAVRGEGLAWMTVVSCGWAILLYGYDQGVMSGLISLPQFNEEMLGSPNSSAGIKGLVVAIYGIGAFVGAISAMLYAGRKFGRRITVTVGQAFAMVGAALQASSFSLPQTIVARIITGIGKVGQITATVPVWMAEIAPPSRRGLAGGIMMICGPLGLLIAYWIDYGVSSYASGFSFRFPLAFQAVFCVGQFLTMPFLPESPRWLVAKGRVEAASTVIASIHGVNHIRESDDAQLMFNDIQQAVTIEHDGKPAWKELVTSGPLRYRRRVVLAFATQAMQQLAGINVFAYYSTVIFEQSLGKSSHDALIMGGFTALVFFLGGCVGSSLADRLGRRVMLMSGFAGASIGMALGAIGTSETSYSFGVVATFGIFFFQFIFGAGLLIPPWVYGVEIMPLKLRALGGSISAASGWIWNFAVVQVTPAGLESLGYGYFIMWAAFNFCFIWVIFCE
ncbi:hypothetical protein M409DRAFT_38271 [Zasmidium cellare ATCC 36951]|uniref:Major facilitator superfamily (MFS) profile domain-containing protein n=1 Tax=Zasmidium cellare ATCC 36951 TaxID=1080233 RepID=A0A6A6BWQ2_ZASCE|nr:uncharacterized protein M409DRAFT_38271 [Zasmidium cellare ATCC 36951]KAF2158390.1 hypothetical protein M409DRAFT_38271 [Zasmidium cellare ATCC 36951]